MIENLGLPEQVLGGTTLLGLCVFFLQKLMTSWKSEGAHQAGATAAMDQFKALQASIAANKLESDREREADKRDITELRAQFNIMDKKIHVQQRTITRMEMLLRQFSGLVSQHGITVPGYMQEELEVLIERDADLMSIAPENRRRSDV